MALTRGWILPAITLASVGIVFLLWGFGLDLGNWWPIVFCAFGAASLVRGMKRRENVVFGLLLIGWGAIGVAALNAAALGISNTIPFLIGAGLIWIPAAMLFGRDRG